MTVTLTNINGAADENDKNDVRNVTVTGIVPADRKVVAEEGTGTWVMDGVLVVRCSWIPWPMIIREDGPFVRTMAIPWWCRPADAGVGSFPGFGISWCHC